MLAVTASDHVFAADAATRAGQLLLALRAEHGGGGRAVGALGDREANDLLRRRISGAFPQDGLLSEEAADHPDRLDRCRVWIVDPLDGTREFSEGRADWAVHVALVVNGSPVAGAVALPDRGLTLATPSVSPPPPSPPRLRLVVSRTRPPDVALAVAGRLDAELLPMGSAGAKTMAVVLGEADAYIHGGGQYEWDSAAPVAVARAAGLHVSRLDGSPLRYNQPNPWLPDLLVCRPHLAPTLLPLLAESS